MPTAKTLQAHVYDATFRARRHHELLVGPVVADPKLAVLHGACLVGEHPLERRQIAVELERTVRARREQDAPEDLLAELEEILAMPPVPISVGVQPVRRAFAAARKSRVAGLAGGTNVGVPRPHVDARCPRPSGRSCVG